MTNDEILQAAKVERDRIVTEVMLSHTEEVDGFSYRWFARRIADEVAAIIEKRTIERCAVVAEELRHPYGFSGENVDWCAGTDHAAAAIRKLGEQE